MQDGHIWASKVIVEGVLPPSELENKRALTQYEGDQLAHVHSKGGAGRSRSSRRIHIRTAASEGQDVIAAVQQVHRRSSKQFNTNTRLTSIAILSSTVEGSLTDVTGVIARFL